MRVCLQIIAFIFFCYSCNEAQKAVDEQMPKIEATVLIPFLPNSCHQCSDEFYSGLSLLKDNGIDFSLLLSEEYSDEEEFIKEEYGLKRYEVGNFLFSSTLYNAYHVYEQNYVLQFGVDSNYIVFDQAKELLSHLSSLNKIEKIDLGGDAIKKSTFNIATNGKKQIFVKDNIRQNKFDFVELNNEPKTSAISFTAEQLSHNFLSNFKDDLFAENKLKEVSTMEGIPNKNVFDQGVFVNDSLFVFSSHTYIDNIIDSTLGGFLILNIYKDGQYLGNKAIRKDYIPDGFMIMPQFHLYGNRLYIELVKKSPMASEQPDYFLGMFESKNNEFQFEKMLHFTVPAIHKDVGYSFLELKFSGKYFMTSISNALFNLETETVEYLNIPVNEKFDFNDLASNCKGVNIVIDNINVHYPNLLISYFSKDAKGVGTSKVLNYDLKARNVVGKIQMPLDNSRFLKPDLLNFGYYMWTPKKGNNDYLLYKKLY